MQARHKLRPVPALDGLRGLAVAAVVLFHFPTNRWFPGGQFGVDVFFVLSGFLVTAGLMDDADRSGEVRFRPFIARRAWRLLPALVAFLAVFVVMAAFFRRDAWFTTDPFGAAPPGPIPLTRVFTGVAAALLYVFNIVLVRGMATAVPLAHLWTLAIEGQFYIGWALLLRRLLRARPETALAVTITAVAGSAVVPWLVWDGGAGDKLIYFGTLPRLQQLLAGAVLAQIWRRGGLHAIPAWARRAAAAAGGATLVWVLLDVGSQTFKYLGAETVNAVAAAAEVAHLLVAPGGAWSARLLSLPPLRWLGTRSYAIYLWHWPMAVWTGGMAHRVGVPLGIVASLALAELSWRLVEQPAQRLRRRLQPAPAEVRQLQRV